MTQFWIQVKLHIIKSHNLAIDLIINLVIKWSFLNHHFFQHSFIFIIRTQHLINFICQKINFKLNNIRHSPNNIYLYALYYFIYLSTLIYLSAQFFKLPSCWLNKTLIQKSNTQLLLVLMFTWFNAWWWFALFLWIISIIKSQI